MDCHKWKIKAMVWYQPTSVLQTIATQPGSTRNQCARELDEAGREAAKGLPSPSWAGLPGRAAQHLALVMHIPGASTLRKAQFTFHLSVWKNTVEGKRNWGLQVKRERERFQSNFFKDPFICLLRKNLNLSDAVNHLLFEIWQCCSNPNSFSWLDGNGGAGELFSIPRNSHKDYLSRGK